jgi:hypothetical protein
LVFGSEERIFVSTASDELKFGTPVLVARLDGLMLGMRRGPAQRFASDAADPAIASPTGGRGPVVMTWEERKHGTTRIQAALLEEMDKATR